MDLPIWAKIGVGWTVAASVGIYAFILSKKSINTQRYENMKARQRMREANIVD